MTGYIIRVVCAEASFDQEITTVTVDETDVSALTLVTQLCQHLVSRANLDRWTEFSKIFFGWLGI